jgi:hypothetical protein
MSKILRVWVVVLLLVSVPGVAAEASWFTYPVSALSAPGDFNTVVFGTATLVSRTNNGTSVDFEFSGVSSGGSGVKDDYAVLTVYGQSGASDFSGFTGAAILVENLDDETVKMHLFMNTGFTAGCWQNDTFWGGPWYPIQPGETVLLTLDFGNAEAWNISDNPLPHTCGVSTTCGVGNSCVNGNKYAINAYDQTEVSGIGFEILKDSGDGNALVRLTPCTAPPDVYVDASWTGTPTGDQVWIAGHPATMGYDAFETIQEGVDIVSGSTVNVAAGTYTENVQITKSLALIGAGSTTTTIDGNDVGNTVTITSSDVSVSGFEVTGGWANGGSVFDPYGGVVVNGNGGPSALTGITIEDNKIDNNSGIGVFVSAAGDGGSADNVVIRNCQISNNGASTAGVSLTYLLYSGPEGSWDEWRRPKNILVEGNTISTNSSYGIYMSAGSTIRIQSNDIYNSTKYGLQLASSMTRTEIPCEYVTVDDNEIYGNARNGVKLTSYNQFNTFTGNSIYNNGSGGSSDYYKYGFLFQDGNDNLINGNVITGNELGGLYLWGKGDPSYTWYSTTDNTITNNVIADHTGAGGHGIYVPANYGNPNSGFLNSAINWNSITNNAAYGIECADATQVIDAENNWWGDAAGPTTKAGDVVSDYVDYDPWIGKPGSENVVFVPDPEYIGPDDAGSGYKEEVVINYLGGGSGALYGYSVEVEWDNTVLSAGLADFLKPASGPFSGATFFQKQVTASDVNGPYRVRIDCAIGGSHSGTLGPDDLFRASFTAVGTPDYSTSDLDLIILAMRDSNNQTLSGFYEDDGLMIVDLTGPSVSGVTIANTTLAHTDDYIKNTDMATVTATVTDDDPGFGSSDITANLTGFGGGGSVNPTTYDGTTATWNVGAVTCSPSDGTVTVTVTATDGLGNSNNDNDDITSDNIAPNAITGFDAEPHHERVALSWDNPSGLDTNYYGVVVRYDVTGDYPLYDVSGSYPGSETGGAGDAFNATGVSTSADHNIATRDIYYYSAFVYDWVLHYGPAAGSAQDRAINYWLGDVTDDMTPGGPYDGYVNTSDINSLSAAYWDAPLSSPDDECDVGPTDDASRLGIPEPDDQVEFEDMMIFAMNLNVVSPTAMPPVVQLAGRPETGPPALTLEAESAGIGHEMTVSLQLRGNTEEVKGASMVLTYDAALLELAEITPTIADRVLFESKEAQPGELWIDLAALGTDVVIRGSGEIARITFDVKSDGDMNMRFAEADLRGVSNGRLNGSAEGLAFDFRHSTPAVTELAGAWPNPFNPTTAIQYSLRQADHVTLQIYDAQGRLVRTLVSETLNAGRYSTVWNGRDNGGVEVSSGTYFIRMHTSQYESTSKVVMLK